MTGEGFCPDRRRRRAARAFSLRLDWSPTAGLQPPEVGACGLHRASGLRLCGRLAVAAIIAVLGMARGSALAEEPALPAPKGYVSDYVGVIDAATTRALEAMIAELKAKTGAEIAVVVVRSTQPLTTFDYAMKVAEQWRPGSKRLDNGVVFVVAIEDHQMFILTGYGVEGVLPDGRVGEIRDRRVRPAFRRGDYAGGIRDATREMAGLIATGAGVELTGVPRARRPQALELTPGQLFLLIIGALVLLLLLSQTGMLPLLMGSRRGYGRGAVYPGGFGGGFGGGGFGGGGGGFGGFGGGGFGGGGAGGSW